MGSYDFDREVDGFGTERIEGDEALPWSADMDFPAPPEVIDALHEWVGKGDFGYANPSESFMYSLIHWYGVHYEWIPDKSWCTFVPGVVYALAQAVKAYTRPGDAVIIQRPVYHPFTSVIEDNGRVVANSPLVYDRERGAYTIDFDGFEATIEKYNARLFLLCNPHNPVSRAWTKDELEQLGEICAKHDVVVVSDEINADFYWEPRRHVPFATISKELSDISVICTSASKTFNMSGLQMATVIIPNEDLRAEFKLANEASGYSYANPFGLVATEVGYTKGSQWLDELKRYLWDNFLLVQEYLDEFEGLTIAEFQATYFVWIDCSGLGFTNEDLNSLERQLDNSLLVRGSVFGPEGEGFIRLNIAKRREDLKEALERLVDALKALKHE